MDVNSITLSQIEDKLRDWREFEYRTDPPSIPDIEWLIARVKELELELYNTRRELKSFDPYENVVICK